MSPEVRPTSVRAAAALLGAVAVLSLADAVGTLVVYAKAARASDAAFADTWDGFVNPNSFRDLMRVHVVLGVLAGVVALALLFLIRRGSPGARVTTFVLAGLAVPVFAVAAFVNAGNFGRGGVPGDEVTVAAQRSAAAIPAWSQAVATVGGALCAVAALLVIVLLARQSAGRWFRPGTPVSPPFPLMA